MFASKNHPFSQLVIDIVYHITAGHSEAPEPYGFCDGLPPDVLYDKAHEYYVDSGAVYTSNVCVWTKQRDLQDTFARLFEREEYQTTLC